MDSNETQADSSETRIREGHSTSFSEAYNEALFYQRLFLETYTVLGLTAIVLNILLTVVILRYEKLRRETSNIILSQVIILETIFFVTTIIVLRLFIDFSLGSAYDIPPWCACLMFKTEVAIVFTIFLLFLLLLIDGYIKTHHEEKYTYFQRAYKYLLAGIYTASAVFYVSVSAPCLTYNLGHLIINFIVLLTLQGALVLTLIVLNIVHWIKTLLTVRTAKKPNMGLVLTNIFVISWIPFVCLYIFSVARSLTPMSVIVCVAFGFTSPIFNFVYLHAFNDQYNVFLRRTIRCQQSDQRKELIEEPITFDSTKDVVKVNLSSSDNLSNYHPLRS